MSYTFHAQNNALQNSNDKNVEIVVVSSSKISDSTNVTSLDTTKVQLSMSQVTVKNKAIESEKETKYHLEKKPRIEMFSIGKDSIKLKDKKR
jgi:hypothetical protein